MSIFTPPPADAPLLQKIVYYIIIDELLKRAGGMKK